jgi:hypothetical protein
LSKGKGRRRKPPRQALPIRVTGDLLDRIDEVRPDLTPREPFVRYLIELGLEQLEYEG